MHASKTPNKASAADAAAEVEEESTEVEVKEKSKAATPEERMVKYFALVDEIV